MKPIPPPNTSFEMKLKPELRKKFRKFLRLIRRLAKKRADNPPAT